MLAGADVADCSSDDGAKDFCVAGSCLVLAAAPEVAVSGDKSQGHEDSEDGREASGE